MTPTRRSLSIATFLLLFPVLAHAQGGCVNSPENPTVVLFLIGSASAAVASIRRRIRSSR